MSIAKRKERQRAELRERILQAARQIVNGEGLEQLTIRKIAELIDYAPGTIYLHFEGRHDIVRQLVRESFGELLRYMSRAARLVDPLERLRALGHAYIAFAMEHPAAYRTIFMQPPDIAAAVWSLVKEDGEGRKGPGQGAFAILWSTVRELIDRGVFRKLDAEVVADAIWACVHGIVALHISCPQQKLADADASADLIVEGMVRMFAPAS